MRTTTKILLAAITTALLSTVALRAATTYQLDNGSISNVINASDGTEPLDNWFGNVFTAQVNATTLTNVTFGVFTTAPGSTADVLVYNVTGAGGNPALGATRVYTQAFTPLTGDGTNAFLQQIGLTSPVTFNIGDHFLIAILIRDVIANPPNDKYPFLVDTSPNSTGTYWDRSAPNAFNLDNLSGAVQLDQLLSGGTFIPGPGHVIIRADGVPEPSVLALGIFGGALSLYFLRRKK